MKTAIFSDIHGNLPALEILLENIKGVDQYISLGDVVGYGPWSNECVKLLMGLKNCLKIRGNFDDYFIEKRFTGNNDLAKKFFETSIKNFSETSSLKTFKIKGKLDEFNLTHTLNHQYVFPDSQLTLKENWIIGHSHYQFKISANGFTLYNPGSVGLNRQYINAIDYCLYDNQTKNFDLKRIVYDVEVIIKEMKIRKYPDICRQYYENKNRI